MANNGNAIQSVLGSQTFQKAPALRSLLQYLWDHRHEDSSEYSIAIDAFSRPAGFDPKIDSTVRVQIARLRQKLKEYYEREGQSDIEQITLPLGTHRIEVVSGPAAPVRWQELRIARLKRAVFVLSGMGVVLAAACIVLAVSNRRDVPQAQSAGALPGFWASFFSGSAATRMVLENPVFFRWDSSNLKVRDVRVNDFQVYRESDELAPFVKRYGVPKLMQNYTVTSDSFAAVRLAQFLEAHGRHVAMVGSADWPMDSTDEGNQILLGTAGVNNRVRALLEKTSFLPVREGDRVLNRKPRPGEPAEYIQIFESPKRRTVPGFVGLLPAGPRGRALALIGVETMALANFLTSPSGMARLDRVWKEHGTPPFFESVVEAEVDGSTVLRTKLLAFRSLNASR